MATRTPIVISSMTNDEQVLYAQKMIAMVDEQIACRPESKVFDQEHIDLVAAKNHYILMAQGQA